MIKQLLEEVRQTELDEPSRERLREIYDTSITELSSSLSPDLQEELARLALPFEPDTAPTGPELRIAKAQLVGWLEGLFHGIQATLFAQQMAARQQLEQMRGQLGPGMPPGRTARHRGEPGPPRHVPVVRRSPATQAAHRSSAWRLRRSTRTEATGWRSRAPVGGATIRLRSRQAEQHGG